MMKRFLIAAAVVGLGLPVLTAPAAEAAATKPTASYQGQWWTHPLGCRYSRAGRPGETMWFLIVNTAQSGCPTYIMGKSWGGVYKETGPMVGKR